MIDNRLWEQVLGSPWIPPLKRRLAEGGLLRLGSAADAAQPFLAALLGQLTGQPVLVVTDGLKSQEAFHNALRSFAPAALLYPAWETLPHEDRLPNADIISDRLRVLAAIEASHGAENSSVAGVAPSATPSPGVPRPRDAGLSLGGERQPELRVAPASPLRGRGRPRVVSGTGEGEAVSPAPDSSLLIVASVPALLQRTFAPAHWQSLRFTLRTGQRVDLDELTERLLGLGYHPEHQVSDPGDMARRGGILDFYGLDRDDPVRLEFDGDDIDSIRTFDPVTQQSRAALESVAVGPAGEVGLLKNAPASSAPLLAHLPPATLFVFAEPDALLLAAAEYTRQVPPDDPLSLPWESVLAAAEPRVELTEAYEPDAPQSPAEAAGDLSFRACEESEKLASAPGLRPRLPHTTAASRRLGCLDELGMTAARHVACSLNLRLVSLEAFRPLDVQAAEPQVAEAARRGFFDQMQRWHAEGLAVHVLCGTSGEQDRFGELWQEQFGAPPAAFVRHAETYLSHGFLWPDAALAVVTDAEVFGRQKLVRTRRHYHQLSQPVSWTELQEGDYVVHLQHGIGRFRGLKTLELSVRPSAVAAAALPVTEPDRPATSRQEVLVIEYAGEARLYVPIDQAHLVSKYLGAGRRAPKLHELGGAVWQRQKGAAERAIMDLASELLEIQAARATLQGHAFAPDTAWQREFEAAFPYDETPDQETAIVDTKRDMETARPMDRLICGDVGYGKTEVAIRAAFKAVMEGFQVAVLVPTTVLAEQHFNTFRERMAGFPITVEMLSRFRTATAQRQVAQALAAGGVDIVIGTHRLLSADIAFKNLGLVVIDEEQRFGVLHKERFKQLRRLVDVLTLSATPIPRTLYLALSGARDMSTIQTPPQDRLPVETIIAGYDERLIREAIRRELNRGGQVYFLHNRVQSIDAVADRLRRLLESDDPARRRSPDRAARQDRQVSKPGDLRSAPGAGSGDPRTTDDSDPQSNTESRVGRDAEGSGRQSQIANRKSQIQIAVGHGQMSEHELEGVMHRFVHGQVDVLVCTTIIESGLDIPNANTIIIDRADRFGLADLYQLRGRVGRYKHQAYAYILLPRHLQLVRTARKRISAIKQYSSLGSGFKIAMRDLEIRGAGNILGAEQSGHITAIGFDLYCQLLKESVARLKGETTKRPPAVILRLDFLQGPGATAGAVADTLARIPGDYIADPRLRLEMYRRLAWCADAADVTALRTDLRDRFGPLPRELKLLLGCADLRLAAAAVGLDTVEARGDRVILATRGQFHQVDGKFPRLTKPTPEGRLAELRRLIAALPARRPLADA